MSNVILADTNILSTFAKVGRISLLLQLLKANRLGVTPAVYEEFQIGVTKGYTVLQPVIDLIEQEQIELLVPNAQEILQKSALPSSFDTGERETLIVARSRSLGVLTNERHVKNWCLREQVETWDLPGILRALWRHNVINREQVRRLIEEIEAKDRVVFRNKEQILAE